MTPSISKLIIFALFFSGFLGPAQGLMRPASEEEIDAHAKLVVHGRVTGIEAKRSDRAIFTYITIDVIEILKNETSNTPRKITIRTKGGRLGDEVMFVSNSPHFELDEEVLVCVKPANGFYELIFRRQGKATLKRPKASAYNTKGLKLLDRYKQKKKMRLKNKK